MTGAAKGGRDTVAELSESLRLARRELTLARRQQESAAEKLQAVRRERARLRQQVGLLSDALAALLSERYWENEGAPRSRRLGRSRLGGTTERELVAEVEASDLFDGGWYLRQNTDALEKRLSPALHYVRIGSRKGAEPGPRFDTEGYLRDHPTAVDSGLPPLVHHLRHAGG
jgi:hypothetical protein